MQPITLNDLIDKLGKINGIHKTPVLNALLLNHPDFLSAWIARPDSPPPSDKSDNSLFVCIVQRDDQTRSYCSYEDDTSLSFELACALYKQSIEWHSSNQQSGRKLKYGAVNSIFVPHLLDLGFMVNLEKLWDVFIDPSQPSSSSSSGPPMAIDPPPGMILTTVRERDIETVLESSEIAHEPSYIRTLLPRSSALYKSSNPQDREKDDEVVLVAHAFTSRDGSLTTLAVAPSERKRGYGKFVARHRIQAVRDEFRGRVTPFACVGESNEQSRAVMKGLGFRQAWKVAWLAPK